MLAASLVQHQTILVLDSSLRFSFVVDLRSIHLTPYWSVRLGR